VPSQFGDEVRGGSSSGVPAVHGGLVPAVAGLHVDAVNQ
jgi:hypothetical protein